MIRLDTVNRTLKLFLGAAHTTAPLQIVVSYSDQTTSTYLGGTQLSNSNGTTAVTICSAPAASTIRDIDMVSVLNTDTASKVVTVEMVDTATPYLIATVTLLVGEKLTYTHGSAWQVVSNSGNIKYVVQSTSGVDSFSGGSTGLTPATATTGAVTLGGTLAVASGGTGTASPSLVAGTNVSITGTWPNQTVNATGGTGTVTAVTGTAPVTSSGGTTPDISMSAANATTNGYLTSTDWSTFNGKGSGTVTSVSFTGGIVSVATATTTPALTVAGTSGGIPYFSSGTAWASSAALAANALMIGGGAGSAPSTTTTGTGVVTALGVNIGTVGAFVVNGGALGTPSSGTVTNLTGTASININGTVGATTADTGAFTSLSYTTTLTGGTGIIAIGTNQFYKDASGNIGLGTTAPVSLLDVVGNVWVDSLSATNNAEKNSLFFGGASTVGTQLAAITGYRGSSFSEGALLLKTSTGGVLTERVRINPSGFVGIGTIAPTVPLDVESVLSTGALVNVAHIGQNSGSAPTVGQGARLTLSANSSTSRAVAIDGIHESSTNAHYMAFSTSANGTAPAERMRITSAGGISFGSSGTAYGTSGQALISAGNAAPTWGTLGVGAGGTGLTTGTSGGIPYFSSTSAITSSALLAANALMVGGGAGVAPSTVTTGTGVVTALGVNTGSSGAFMVQGSAIISASTVNDSAGAGYAIGYRQMPQNSQGAGASYTLVLADDGKHIYLTGGTTNALTVPSNASVAFVIGTVITVVNNNSGICTITGPTNSLQLANGALATTRSLATKGMATMVKVATDLWYVSGAGVT